MVTASPESLQRLFDERCFYCSAAPSPLNGVDRMDSFQGYQDGNCVACCAACNRMKRSLDPRTFVARCSAVSRHNGGPGGCADTDSPKRARGAQYSTACRHVTKRGMAMELTKAEFQAIAGRPCHYCGATTPKGNGVDRVDSSKTYSPDNCVPACGWCNLAKSTAAAQDFVDKCKAVAARSGTILANLPDGIPTCTEPRKKRAQPKRGAAASSAGQQPRRSPRFS